MSLICFVRCPGQILERHRPVMGMGVTVAVLDGVEK